MASFIMANAYTVLSLKCLKNFKYFGWIWWWIFTCSLNYKQVWWRAVQYWKLIGLPFYSYLKLWQWLVIHAKEGKNVFFFFFYFRKHTMRRQILALELFAFSSTFWKESNDIASIEYAFWLINFLKDRSIVQLAFFHIRAVAFFLACPRKCHQ